MKDIIIRGTAFRRELYIFLGAFAAAVCTNIFAIIKYDRPAIELVSMIGYVLFTAVLFYFTLLAIRLIIKLFYLIFKKL
jgi:hypothetical protein